jgi:hypothetical protein
MLHNARRAFYATNTKLLKKMILRVNFLVIQKIYLKGLCGRCLSSEAQNAITPPPPYTLYTCIQYTYSHREGGSGESFQPERRFAVQQFTKLGRKYQQDCPVYKLV